MTSEAPKEIYAWVYDQWKTAWNVDPEESDASASRYTLTTHAQAMVAAAYEDATEVVAHDYVCDAIHNRTPDDAQAALDALLKAERVRLLREIEVHHALALTGDVDGRDCHSFVTDIIEKETGQ